MLDIAEYWIELLGTENLFSVVNHYTLYTLRKYSEGDKRSELEGDNLRSLFMDSQRSVQTRDLGAEILFPGVDDAVYQPLHQRFVKMTKNQRGLRSFQSLNNGTKNSLEHFYHVIEHVPYLFDSAARAGYQGGKSIKSRPRVETSLINKFGKREYYAIAFYCITNWKEMKTVSTYRPHEALLVSKDKEAIYWNQYQNKQWFQLAWRLIHNWKTPCIDFPALELKLDSVKKFKVLSPWNLC